jgi:hypothetical protein
MHYYGKWSDEFFGQVGDVADYIGQWLRKWVRMDVHDTKEKFGTVRVYCSFGWSGFYSIYRPGYMWYPRWWPRRLDLWLVHQTSLFKVLNFFIIPLQKWAYVHRYKKAIYKWPHLYKEIVLMADYGELFEGKIPGYKHNDFWTVAK